MLEDKLKSAFESAYKNLIELIKSQIKASNCVEIYEGQEAEGFEAALKRNAYLELLENLSSKLKDEHFKQELVPILRPIQPTVREGQDHVKFYPQTNHQLVNATHRPSMIPKNKDTYRHTTYCSDKE